MRSLSELQQLSRELAQTIRDQRQTIAENNRYIKEQQELIDTMVQQGNSQLLALNQEVAETELFLHNAKKELLKLDDKVTNRRYELVILMETGIS